MNYAIRWDLLGAPVNVGQAVQRGFEQGTVRSAFADLATDPTNQSALSRLAMFDPQSAMQMRDRARTETFRNETRSAFDPVTGQVDPVAMRTAFVNAGNVEGAMEFDRNRATTQRTQQTADREKLERIARLLDDATDEASYTAARQTAIQALGASEADIPPTYDPAWVAQQRRLVAALSNQQEMTSFQRDAIAAGIQPGSTEFREMLMNRYAPPMVAVDVTDNEGRVTRQFIPRPTGSGAVTPPPDLTDDDFREEGGPSQSGSGNFPG